MPLQKHPCVVEVVERYSSTDRHGAPIVRGRWRYHQSADLDSEEASARARELRTTHGAARVSCAAFEALALRNSFALSLFDPLEARRTTVGDLLEDSAGLATDKPGCFPDPLAVDP